MAPQRCPDRRVLSSLPTPSRLALEDEGDYGVQVTNKGGFAISTLATLRNAETKLAPANDNIENAEILFGSQGQEFTVTRNATGQEGRARPRWQIPSPPLRLVEMGGPRAEHPGARYRG